MVAHDKKHFLAWTVIGAVALISSTLAYELALPLFLLNPIIAGLALRVPSVSPFTKFNLRACVLLVRNAFLIAAVAVYKFTGTTQQDVGGVRETLRNTFSLHRGEGDFGFNLWQFMQKDVLEYGVGLPYTAVRAFARYPHLQEGIFAAMIGVTTAVLTLRAARTCTPPSRTRCLIMIVVGFALALAGYSTFFIQANVQFTMAGLGNRVSLMAVPGIAIFLIGITGLISTIVPQRNSSAFIAAVVATLCASGTLVNGTIGSFFAEATRRQEQILSKITSILPEQLDGNTLLIDGFCPYYGPAPLFEAPWDMAGALRVRLHNPRLRADITALNLNIGTDGIHTEIYGFETIYPYGRDLMVVDLSNNTVTNLSNLKAAEHLFDARQNNCPPAQPGVGVRIF